MKRKIFGVFMVLAIGLGICAIGSLPAQAEPIKLTYSNFFPPAHIQSKLAEAWCQEVNKRM